MRITVCDMCGKDISNQPFLGNCGFNKGKGGFNRYKANIIIYSQDDFFLLIKRRKLLICQNCIENIRDYCMDKKNYKEK